MDHAHITLSIKVGHDDAHSVLLDNGVEISDFDGTNWTVNRDGKPLDFGDNLLDLVVNHGASG